MERQFKYVRMIFDDLVGDIEIHIANRKGSPKFYSNGNYMNKNFGKYALKRKIIFLRQELLNLERMLDDEGI